jgi:hypothetical protein
MFQQALTHQPGQRRRNRRRAHPEALRQHPRTRQALIPDAAEDLHPQRRSGEFRRTGFFNPFHDPDFWRIKTISGNENHPNLHK